jgi:hypothetical protein
VFPQKEEEVPNENGIYAGSFEVFDWGKEQFDKFSSYRNQIKEPREFYLQIHKSGNHYVSVLIIRDMDRKYPFDRDGMVKINGFVHPYYDVCSIISSFEEKSTIIPHAMSRFRGN